MLGTIGVIDDRPVVSTLIAVSSPLPIFATPHIAISLALENWAAALCSKPSKNSESPTSGPDARRYRWRRTLGGWHSNTDFFTWVHNFRSRYEFLPTTAFERSFEVASRICRLAATD